MKLSRNTRKGKLDAASQVTQPSTVIYPIPARLENLSI